MVHRYRFTAIFSALSIALCQTPAFASGGGVRIIVQEWTPANPTVQKNTIVLDRPGLIGDAIDQGWAKARTQVCDAIKTEAGKPDRLAKGYTLYHLDCSMAQTGSVTVTGLAGNVLTVSYRLPGNMFKGTTTQPTVAGKYADPCFFFTYDVTAATSIHLDTLSLEPFTVAIANVSRPDSCNAAGDIARFAATTYHFFGGPDYLALVQSSLQRTESISTAPLNAALKSVIDPIQSYSKQYATRTNWIKNGNIYIAFAPVYTPVALNAGIAGTIDIQKGERVPAAPDCTTFALTGTVQTGPAPIYDPVNMTVTDPPVAHVGSGAGHGTAADAGSRFACAFTAAQMPAGVPVKYAGSGIAGPAFKGRPPYKVGLLPDGWSGQAALTSVTPGKNFVAVAFPTIDVQQQVPVDRTLVPQNNPNYALQSRVNPVVLQTTNAQLTALNPQPLPPGGDTNLATGNRLFAKGDFAGAAAAFDLAHASNPKSAIAMHNLALAHARLGQTAQALSEFRSASSLASASGDAATANASAKAIIIVGGAPH